MSSNKYRNEVEFDLNGTRYTLRATFEALAKIEQAADKPLAHIAADFITGQARLEQMVDIMYFASVDDVSKEQIREDIVSSGTTLIHEALGEFFGIAFEGAPSGEGKKKQPRKRSTTN